MNTDHAPFPPADSADVTAAADLIAERSGRARHDVLVVAGSGWSAAADLLGEARMAVPLGDVPGCVAPSVAGHGGQLRSLTVGRSAVLMALGRTHLYEGHPVDKVVHLIRVAHAAGCSTVIITNGCGAVDPTLTPGSPVLLSDHLNLTGTSPLVGPVFVDLTETYSQRLRDLALGIDPTLRQGVYAQFRGPQYETPAEVRMARVLGADLVGMSTVLEAIEARRLGLDVLGISLVTNLAAGVSPTPLHHEEVIAAGRAAAPRLGTMLHAILGSL